MAQLGTLGIGVNLDLSKFEGNVTGLKRSFRTIDSELKANMSAFQGVEKSAESLGTQLDGLTKKQEAQNKIVDEQKKKYDELAKAKGESSREAMQAANNLNKEISSLNKLESQIGKVSDELSTIDFDGNLGGFDNSMKVVTASLEATMSEFAGMEDSVESLSAELDGLSDQYEIQTSVVEESRKKYEELRDIKGENSQEAIDAEVNLLKETAALNQLGAEIGQVGDELNTVDFDMNLDGLSDSMKVAEASLEATMSGMSEAGDTTEYLEAQLEGLSSQYDIQTSVVEESRKKYEELARTKGESSKEAKEAEVSLLNETTALNKLESQIGETESELGSLESANEDVASSAEVVEPAFTSAFDGVVSAVRSADDAVKSAASSMEGEINRISDSLIGIGGGMKSIGGDLTKWVTAPALGAATAAGGITAAFGWERLKGLDNAKAQLKGMGYDTEEVGQITDEVTSAIENGMMTMAEGTSVAAGAMAAGVEQGDELAKYIQLVDSAAVGSGRSVDDMAAIFNRVQGAGSLMTGELNQIEHSMPGFAGTMAETLGVTEDAFRDMVSSGEVSSEQFLVGMDEYAGGLAEAHAETVDGMQELMKSYTGIIGENLLGKDEEGGIYNQIKELMAEINEVLSSEDMIAWAAETGEKLAEVFSQMVDSIKSVIEWFTGLDDEQREMMLTVGGLVVALGPLLTALGTFVGVVGLALKPLAGLFGALGSKGIMGIIATLGKRLLFFLGPIGAVIGGFFLFKDVLDGLGVSGDGIMDMISGIGDAIGAIFRGDKSDGQLEFLESLGLSPEAINTVYDIVERVKNIVTNGFDLIKSIISGDSEGTADALEGLGITPEMQEKIGNMMTSIGDNLKSIVDTIVENLMPIIGEVIEYIGDLFSRLSEFWSENGEAIIETITKIFDIASNVINVVLPIVFGVIKMIFNNIKGFLDGVFKVIGGVIETITGLFTGDFSKMWEGLKSIFFGAVQAIWNGLQLLFWGRIIKGVMSFVKLFTGNIRNLWTRAVEIFSNLRTNVVKLVTNLRNRAVDLVRNLLMRAVEIFVGLRERAGEIVGGLRDRVVEFVGNLRDRAIGIFNNVRDRITETVGNLRDRASNIFTNMRDKIVEIATKLKNRVVGRVTDLRDGIVDGVKKARQRAVEIFDKLKDRAEEIFDDMVSFAKDLPGRIGDAIKKGAKWAVDGVKDLGNSLAEKLGEVVNGVIGGINWVTGKIGIEAEIPEMDVPEFSKGTRGGGHKGGLMTVGDKGAGNSGPGRTRELVQFPNGRTALFNDETTLNAPKGTQVLSNKLTEQLLNAPKFSGGIGNWLSNKASSAINFAQDISGKIGNVVGDVWNAISNPSQLVKNLVDTMGLEIEGLSGFASDFTGGLFKNVTSGVADFFKRTEEEQSPQLGMGSLLNGHRINYGYGNPPGYPFGKHYGIDTNHVYDPVHSPMSGTVTRNFWDTGGGNSIEVQSGKIYQWFMHMSRSLVKAGDKISEGQKVGISGNTGAKTTGPHLHYQLFRNRGNPNGSSFDPMSKIGDGGDFGFYTGGLIDSEGFYHLAERGQELVTATNDKESIIKSLHYLNSLLGNDGSGNTRTADMPNPKGGNGSSEIKEQNSLLKEMVTMMKESNERDREDLEHSRQRTAVLEEILYKEFNIELDGRKVSKQMKPHLDREEERKSNRERR